MEINKIKFALFPLWLFLYVFGGCRTNSERTMITIDESANLREEEISIIKRTDTKKNNCSYELISQTNGGIVLENKCLGDVIENVVYEDGLFKEESVTLFKNGIIVTYFEDCCLRMKAYNLDLKVPVTFLETNGNASFAFVNKSDSSLVYCSQTEFKDSLNPFIIEYEIKKTYLSDGHEILLTKRRSLHLPERLDLLMQRDSLSSEIFKEIGY